MDTDSSTAPTLSEEYDSTCIRCRRQVLDQPPSCGEIGILIFYSLIAPGHMRVYYSSTSCVPHMLVCMASSLCCIIGVSRCLIDTYPSPPVHIGVRIFFRVTEIRRELHVRVGRYPATGVFGLEHPTLSYDRITSFFFPRFPFGARQS